MERRITQKELQRFMEYLYEEEKSPATVQKYMRDITKLMEFARGQNLDKRKIIEYKEMLRDSKKYQLSSINSFLAAANSFFAFMGWQDLKVRTFRIQKKVFVPENKDLTKEEYRRLVRTAKEKGKMRLALILETICVTGIRISELAEITVSSVVKGMAVIYGKGKVRQILIPGELQKNLLSQTVFSGRGRLDIADIKETQLEVWLCAVDKSAGQEMKQVFLESVEKECPQLKKGGDKVKPQDTLYVIMSGGNQEVMMPDLSGLKY